MILDWLHDDRTKIQKSKDKFVKAMNQTNPRDVDYIFLDHDTRYQTAW